MIARHEHSSLFGLVINSEEKKFYNIGTRGPHELVQAEAVPVPGQQEQQHDGLAGAGQDWGLPQQPGQLGEWSLVKLDRFLKANIFWLVSIQR